VRTSPFLVNFIFVEFMCVFELFASSFFWGDVLSVRQKVTDEPKGKKRRVLERIENKGKREREREMNGAIKGRREQGVPSLPPLLFSRLKRSG
jgi:hypothetical protein